MHKPEVKLVYLSRRPGSGSLAANGAAKTTIARGIGSEKPVHTGATGSTRYLALSDGPKIPHAGLTDARLTVASGEGPLSHELKRRRGFLKCGGRRSEWKQKAATSRPLPPL